VNLEAEDRAIRGSSMRFEVDDGVLHFFVNYDRFLYESDLVDNRMDGFDDSQNVNGGV
jgi:hypothetical protein